ncbi:MAG: class I SAM-dependent methyltransferase [Polyangiaceae bacterium]|nr:class I SAM-dependent methyltransferase [Polyangiaceae bacterium]
MRPVDFGKAAREYARYRGGFPDTFYERLAQHGMGLPGQRVLDLGTGTGNLARALVRRGCQVTGLDASEDLIAEARRMGAQEGIEVEYVTARAERSGLQGQSFDGVTAGQCWQWFDGAKAALECKRLLVPGGWLAIVHFDWLPLAGNVVEATEKLIEDYNTEWTLGGGTGLYPQFLKDLGMAGLESIETFSFDQAMSFSHEAWRGRVRASAGLLASLPRDVVARFDEKLRTLLVERFPAEPLVVPHRLWAITCRRAGKA